MKENIDLTDVRIPISLFDDGYAEKIFEQVQKDGIKVVMHHNVPECVLIAPEKYARMIEALEDLKLYAIASERMEHMDSDTLVSQEEFDKMFGFTDEDDDNSDNIDIVFD